MYNKDQILQMLSTFGEKLYFLLWCCSEEIVLPGEVLLLTIILLLLLMLMFFFYRREGFTRSSSSSHHHLLLGTELSCFMNFPKLLNFSFDHIVLVSVSTLQERVPQVCAGFYNEWI